MDTRPEPTAPGGDPLLAAAPFCRDLCSKKLAFRKVPPRTEDDVLDASRHCWCRRTQQSLGPDGDFVSPADCQAGRECFQSLLAPRSAAN